MQCVNADGGTAVVRIRRSTTTEDVLFDLLPSGYPKGPEEKRKELDDALEKVNSGDESVKVTLECNFCDLVEPVTSLPVRNA